MPGLDEPLQENEIGPYGDLTARPNPHGLVIMPVPPFESLLGFIEQNKGRKLTPDEIEDEKQRCACMVVTPEVAKKVTAARRASGETPNALPN